MSGSGQSQSRFPPHMPARARVLPGIIEPLGIIGGIVHEGRRTLDITGKGPDGRDITLQYGLDGFLAINGRVSTLKPNGHPPRSFTRVYPEGISLADRALFDRASELARDVIPGFTPIIPRASTLPQPKEERTPLPNRFSPVV